MVQPLKARAALHLIVEDFRARANAMIALPPDAVGTCEMRVNARKVLRLLDELDRLKHIAGSGTTVSDAFPDSRERGRTDLLQSLAAR